MTSFSRLFLLTLLVNTHSLFAASFPAFEGTVRVPVGNHGAASVTLLDPDHLQTTHTYLTHTEEIVLDLRSESIVTRSIDYHGTEIVEKKEYPPADQGGSYLPWRHQMVGMINAMTWITQNLFLLSPEEKLSRTPEMQAVLSYLNTFLASEDAAAPDSIEIFYKPIKLRRGVSYTFMIEYLAHTDRDILLEIFDGQWKSLQAVRMRVPAGRDTKNIAIRVPADVPTPQDGFVAVKLVPIDSAPTQKLAEDSTPVILQNKQIIETVSASWISYTEVPSLSLYVNFYCPESCEVQADVFDKNGKWLAGQVVPADKPFIEDAEQFSSFNFKAPSQLFPLGETYHYTVKIQPIGAPNQAYAQFQGDVVAAD